MGRRRTNKSSFLDEAFELFAITPMWVGPVAAAIVFVIVRFAAPLLFPPNRNGPDVNVFARDLTVLFAWILAAATLLAWLAAEFYKLVNRRLLDKQTGSESIRDLSWKEFEHLVCEAYRRKGYLAETVGSEGGDGGVDVELRAKNELVLVQCKHWNAFTVGVKTVREMLGIVVSRRATKGIVVTSKGFTEEAIRFAKQNSQIELVDGPALTLLIASVRANPVADVKPPAGPVTNPPMEASPQPEPLCPSCGTGMVLRTAKRGNQIGSVFWGCPRYPACRGTRQIS